MGTGGYRFHVHTLDGAMGGDHGPDMERPAHGNN